MNLQAALNERNMTMYHLSKISGIPKTTVIDICSGKSSLEKCSAKTVYLIAKALGLTMEDLLVVDDCYDEYGRPADKTYLEHGLPEFLQISLDRYKQAEKDISEGKEVSLLDCYYCELQSDINSCEVNGIITSDHAWYLREKFLNISRC